MLSVRLVPTNMSIPLIERVLVEKQPLMLGRKVKTSEQLAHEAASLEDANRINAENSEINFIATQTKQRDFYSIMSKTSESVRQFILR